MEFLLTHFCLYPANKPRKKDEEIDHRFRDKGTHTSRTMMLVELEAVLEMTEVKAKRSEYASVIIDANCVSKAIASPRRLLSQRLSELYGLAPRPPLFRVLRWLWNINPTNRLRLALLAVIARDLLLAATNCRLREGQS